MIDEVLSRKEFVEDPPVLLDIGASGELTEVWKNISKYCIGIAFDGDDRDFAYIQEKSKNYKKLIVVNKIVSTKEGPIDFYLTRSPYCSSTLKPNHEGLKNYAFASLFEIEKVIQLEAVTLASILSSNGINRIDWYKSDTQGTDLRIVASLSDELINKGIIYEMEPGIINGYVGEDKFYSVLEFFNERGFIAIDATIKGSYRLNLDTIKNRLPEYIVENLQMHLPATPDWCEIAFFNPFSGTDLSLRDYLLAWVFATIKKQHGLAIEIAFKANSRFTDPVFNKMIDCSIENIKEPSTNVNPSIKQKIKNRLIRIIQKV